MDDQELLMLLQDLESDRVERKVSAADRERICEAICAFANDLPNHQRLGVLFIGVGNDGSCAHLTITDELLLTLAGMRSDGNIMPFPTMTVQVENCRKMATHRSHLMSRMPMSWPSSGSGRERNPHRVF